jgi:methylmalonyl-CoA mutase cobalamin-binding subunit
MSEFQRARILPETNLPHVDELIAQGRELAKTVRVKPGPFLQKYNVASESEFKRQRMAQNVIMFHSQIGYRQLEKSKRAYAEIFERLDAVGYRIDRYGICLDWNMGYPWVERAQRPRGTGMILERPADFIALTHSAPVAPHFGDFMIGMPAAVENVSAALEAGSTSIGNLGQYFTYRLPHWHDEIATTSATLMAIALCAAQPVEVLIHSNLDDGFAPLFNDLSCVLGMVLIERYLVEELMGGKMTHCYGHTFENPLTRLAFQRALARVNPNPGSMIYGNTTIYVEGEIENYANLASYLWVDIVAQKLLPTGHAINPIPVTEALRIPEIDEIVNAQLFANRLAARAENFPQIMDVTRADEIADQLVTGGKKFHTNILQGMSDAGIDIRNPFELMLALRRIGAKKMEHVFGPGELRTERGRAPVVMATTIAALQARADKIITALDDNTRAELRAAGAVVCVASTDVHEYGKILLEAVLERLEMQVVDCGVAADADAVARRAQNAHADAIAISTYNGIALAYLRSLREELQRLGISPLIFIGGRLNQIPDNSANSMPVDVSDDLRVLGAYVCLKPEDMLMQLRELVEPRGGQWVSYRTE